MLHRSRNILVTQEITRVYIAVTSQEPGTKARQIHYYIIAILIYVFLTVNMTFLDQRQISYLRTEYLSARSHAPFPPCHNTVCIIQTLHI